MENKRALIRERCRKFPTLFNLDVPLGVIQVESAIAKLKREHECPNLAEEFGNELNLLNSLAYFYLRRNKYKDAKPLVEEALAKEPHSLTALANQCEMFLIQYKFPEAEKAVCAMEKESENKEAIVTALAEQGYCYTRMGPIAYMEAIAKFTQAITMGYGHCSADKMASWNFSMASNCSRSMVNDVVKEHSDFNIEEHFEKGCRSLKYVINSGKSSLIAKAYIVLGEMTKHYWQELMRKPMNYDRDKVIDVTDEKITVSQCFELACELGPSDYWVLERAGKHQRHRRQYEKALELLWKAHSIYSTAFNLHHLGLTYKSLALKAHEEENPRERRSQSQPRYGGNDRGRERGGMHHTQQRADSREGRSASWTRRGQSGVSERTFPLHTSHNTTQHAHLYDRQGTHEMYPGVDIYTSGQATGQPQDVYLSSPAQGNSSTHDQRRGRERGFPAPRRGRRGCSGNPGGRRSQSQPRASHSDIGWMEERPAGGRDWSNSFHALRSEQREHPPCSHPQGQPQFFHPCSRRGDFPLNRGRLQRANYGASRYASSTTQDHARAIGRGMTPVLPDRGWRPPRFPRGDTNARQFRGRSSQEQYGDSRESSATVAHENVECQTKPSRGQTPFVNQREETVMMNRNYYFNLYANTKNPKVIQNLTMAIECMNAAIHLSSEESHALNVALADIYTSLGQHEEADECFIKSLQQTKYISHFSYSQTYEKWGLAMKNRGEKEKSQDFFRMAIEHAAKAKVPVKVAFQCLMRDMTESQIPKPEQLRSQSELCQLVGRHQEALSLLWEADKQSPANPETLSGLIKNLAAKRHYELARMYLAILQHTEGSDETIDPTLQVEICFGAAERNPDTLSLIGLRDTYECLLRNPLKPQGNSQDIFIFHANNSQADSQLAVHIQHLAKEVGQVECETLDDQPAGTLFLDIMEEIVNNFDAVFIILTPDFIADRVRMNLCKHLVDKPCVLLCLHMQFSKDAIPLMFHSIYKAAVARKLCQRDFGGLKDPIQKLHIWREIFNHLLAAKSQSQTGTLH